MGKSAHQDVLRNGANEIVDNADEYYVCSDEPTTYNEATSTYALAYVSVSSSDFTWTNITEGEKLTVAAKSNISIDADGTMTHVALVDTGTSRVLAVNITNSQELYAGNLVSLPSWTLIARNPK